MGTTAKPLGAPFHTSQQTIFGLFSALPASIQQLR